MTTAAAEKRSITCGGCNASRAVKPTKRDNARLPRGWKRRPDPAGGEAVLCADCWKKLFRLRAITFPVQGVQEGGDWKEFCAAVRQSLFRSRTLAQWAINQLAAHDVARTLEMDKLPPHPPLGAADKVYLYGLAAGHYPDWNEWAGAYTAAQSVLHSVKLKYDARRADVVWRAEASLPTIRSQPYPVPAQNWSAEYVETTNEETEQTTRVPAVSLPLGGRRWLIRLRGGQQRARQLAAFRQLVSGEAEACELAIYRKRSQASRDRTGTTERNGAGSKVRHDIMVKLVCWLPRETRAGAKRQGVLTVHSSQNALLVAMHPEYERPWTVNRNDVRQRISGHQKRLERISEDMKAETRPRRNPPGPWPTLNKEEKRARRRAKRQRKRRQGFLDTITRNFDQWHDAIVKELASWLVRYADRSGVAKIALDLSEQSYCPGFRWSALRERIRANASDLSPPIEVEITGDTIEESNENNGSDAPDQTSA